MRFDRCSSRSYNSRRSFLRIVYHHCSYLIIPVHESCRNQSSRSHEVAVCRRRGSALIPPEAKPTFDIRESHHPNQPIQSESTSTDTSMGSQHDKTISSPIELAGEYFTFGFGILALVGEGLFALLIVYLCSMLLYGLLLCICAPCSSSIAEHKARWCASFKSSSERPTREERLEFDQPYMPLERRGSV